MRPAFPGYRTGFRSGWYGGGWRRAGYYRGYRGYPYWGVASGLAAAATLGAIAGYPYYDYEPVYPAYPVYPVYGAVPTAAGGMCRTPVRTCTLYEPAPLGVGCSCRAPGGRAKGMVVGP